MSVLSHLPRPLVAAVLGAALLAPVQPAVTAVAAPPSSHASAHATAVGRATQSALTAYGDADDSGAVHLSGSVRWANGKVLGHKQHVELWGRTGKTWALVQKALIDRDGDVELSVTPTAHTTYRLRYAGSHSRRLSSVAAPSTSPTVQVRAVAKVTLKASAKAHRGETFVVTGTVTPAGAGRVVTLTGNGTTFTTLRTRADGSFSGRVRLRMTTTLVVTVPAAKHLDGGASEPRTVRVS